MGQGWGMTNRCRTNVMTNVGPRFEWIGLQLNMHPSFWWQLVSESDALFTVYWRENYAIKEIAIGITLRLRCAHVGPNVLSVSLRCILVRSTRSPILHDLPECERNRACWNLSIIFFSFAGSLTVYINATAKLTLQMSTLWKKEKQVRPPA